MKKWFTPDYAGSTVWPAAPKFNGPNDAWYSLDMRNGGWP
jgi:hypothetical protein